MINAHESPDFKDRLLVAVRNLAGVGALRSTRANVYEPAAAWVRQPPQMPLCG